MLFIKYHNSAIKRYLVKKMLRIHRRGKPELQKSIVKFLTLKWVLTRCFISLESYKKLYPDKINFIFQKNTKLYYSAINFYNSPKPSELQKNNEIKSYAAVINDVSIISGSNLIIPDDKYVFYDFKDLADKTNIDFTDHGMGVYKNDYCIIEANFDKKQIEEGILFTGNYDANLYHFIFEIIARFETLEVLSLPKHIPLLVNKACLKYDQFVQILNHFNKDKREIIELNNLVVYGVTRLYYVSCPNIIPPNYLRTTEIKSNQNLFDVDNLFFLRKNFLELIEPTTSSKKILISRKDSSGRRAYNELEISNFLEKRGFQVIYPFELSIAEQISIFNNAEVIVGATGAAFSNILFCNKNCKIICLTNYKVDLSIFSTIASFVGANLVYLFDENLKLNETSDIHSDFNIDIHQLSEALNN